VANLPIILPAGTIAVYGDGTISDASNRMPSGALLSPDYRFGTIYHIWDGGATYVYGGDVVYWKDGAQQARIVTSDNLTFTLLPARLVTTDVIVIVP
jgi:hypothetical protein